MGDTGSGGGAADSYIGSLISLTSKSEIRYEGILYTVDTVNSNIALQDVRSFGTEGRKKDGPQIPSSDKVYDYIIFRGTDIKDLQVKSSPPTRAAPPPQGHHDPAIISVQSQTPPIVPPSSSLNTGSTAGTNPTDLTNSGPYPNIPSPAYQNGIPYSYPPYGGMGSWNMSQMHSATNGTAPLPMYWPNYYRPPPQQQSQIPLQTPSTLTSNYLAQAQMIQEPFSTSTSLPASSLPSESTKDSPSDSLELSLSAGISSSLQMSSSLEYTNVSPTIEERTTGVAVASKIALHTGEANLLEAQSVGTSATQSSKQGPLLNHSKSSDIDTQSQPPLFDLPGAEAYSTKESILASESQSQHTSDKPLLPLPASSVRQDQGHDSSISTVHMHMQRGRGRGRGYGMMNSQPRNKFAEDFDFMAMNEKFNKDEVWGELGKAGVEEISEEYHHEEEDVSHASAAYVKDDFFDSLSSNAFDRSGQIERPRFSEQRRLDTETFGKFSVRHHGGRGGRGGFRGGNRGGYYGGGRGNGYGGRGRSTSRYPQSY